MDTAGAVVGPLLALALVSLTHDNLRLILALAFIPGAIGALLVLTVRDIRHTHAVQETWFRFSAMPRTFRAYLLAWGVFAVANSSDVFLILRAGQLGYGTAAVIGLYVLYNLVYAAASPYLGGLSDRIGRKRVMRGGLIVFALVYLGFAFVRAPWQLWVLFAVYGLYVAATEGVGKALAVDLVSKDRRGSAVGVLGTVTGVATLLASTAAGVLWSTLGPSAAFLFGAAGALGSAVLFTVLRPLRES
jgi:MFS family permease